MIAKQISAQEINEKLYKYDAIGEKLGTLDDIDQKQVAFYREQGYLAVDNALGETLVSSSIEALMDHVYDPDTDVKVQFVKPQSELKTNEDRELAVRKVYNFAEIDERLHNAAYDPSLLAAVEKLLSEKPVLVQDMALLKPPFGGGEKPWHQDMAYGGLAFDKPVVGVWIALDDAALDNGCMHIIPRSHMDGGIPHYAVRDWQVCDANVPVHRDVVVPLTPGGALFFHGLLVHGTPSNFSDKRRRALQFHYVGASSEKISPKEYKRVFTNEMSGAEC